MNKVPWGQPESRGERNTCSNNYDPARELINHKMERGKGKNKSMACFSKEGAETGRRWLGDSRGKENKPRAKKQPIFRERTLGIIMTKWDLENEPGQGCSGVRAGSYIIAESINWHKSLGSSLVLFIKRLRCCSQSSFS